MPKPPNQVARYEASAREHLGANYGTPGDEFGATLFVTHHLNEIDAAYWTKHTGTGTPDPRQVLEMLVLGPLWDEDDEEEEEDGRVVLDFTLPDGVTNYVICVDFDEAGNVANVSMES